MRIGLLSVTESAHYKLFNRHELNITLTNVSLL